MAATNSTTNLGLPQWVEGDEILREDFNAAMSDIDDAIGSPTLTWTTVTTFSNDWVDTFPSTWPVQYSKDAYGIVRLRGCIKAGANNTVPFILPEKYRPSRLCMFVSLTYGSTTVFDDAVVFVNTDGEVRINKKSTHALHYTPLDCCQFTTN